MGSWRDLPQPWQAPSQLLRPLCLLLPSWAVLLPAGALPTASCHGRHRVRVVRTVCSPARAARVRSGSLCVMGWEQDAWCCRGLGSVSLPIAAAVPMCSPSLTHMQHKCFGMGLSQCLICGSISTGVMYPGNSRLPTSPHARGDSACPEAD